jgi:tetratricopeptide (TPR) repeat protein
MSYRTIHRELVRARAIRGVPEQPVLNTVYRVFQPGRVRVDADLIVDIAQLLAGDEEAAEEWRQACWVVAGLGSAAAIVSVADTWPADLPSFTGRQADLQKLVGPHGGPQPELTIWAISGMPGVGKTRLAVRAGHLLLSHGLVTGPRLAVDLRGYDPDRPPADPNAVLDGLLRRLGMSGDQIQHLDLAGRSAKLRQLLAGRDALLLLDNAAGAEQVRPLLPAEPGCLVLITSRRALPELPSARHLSLDVLTPDEAVGVLRQATGPGPVDTETEAAVAADIVELLGRLPLALGLVASRIRDSSDWTLADHLDRLRHHRRSLRLDSGVEVAISLSYRELPTDQQRVFRLLALHPGNDITAPAAAALTGTDVDAAGRHLKQLTAASLLQCPEPGRYRFHDLIRTYAAALVHDEDAAGVRRAGLSRLCDQYLHTAGLAMDLIYPHERDRRPRIPPSAVPGPALPDPAAARGWLDAERANLLAVATQDGAAIRAFSATLHRHLAVTGRYPDGQILHQRAIAAAHSSGDRTAEAGALLDLAELAVRTGEYDQTIDHAQRALELSEGTGGFEGRALRYLGLANQLTGRYERAAANHLRALTVCQEAGDRVGEASALGNLGVVTQVTGRYVQAAEYHRQALVIFDELGAVEDKARALDHLGVLHQLAGRYEQAADHHRQALVLFGDVGAREGRATALDHLGVACQLIGRYDQAAEHHQQALTLSREIGDRDDEAHALTYLGDLYRRTGEYEEAAGHYQAALDLCRDLGDPQGQAKALNGLGEVARETGDPVQALAAHAEAHQHASKIGQRHEQARADFGLGHAYRDLGNAEQAREQWRQALALYAELGVPEAGEVRASLAALDI